MQTRSAHILSGAGTGKKRPRVKDVTANTQAPSGSQLDLTAHAHAPGTPSAHAPSVSSLDLAPCLSGWVSPRRPHDAHTAYDWPCPPGPLQSRNLPSSVLLRNFGVEMQQEQATEATEATRMAKDLLFDSRIRVTEEQNLFTPQYSLG